MLYDITYVWNLKKQKKLVNITKKEQTHRENILGVTSSDREGKGQYRGRRLRGIKYYVS